MVIIQEFDPNVESGQHTTQTQTQDREIKDLQEQIKALQQTLNQVNDTNRLKENAIQHLERELEDLENRDTTYYNSKAEEIRRQLQAEFEKKYNDANAGEKARYSNGQDPPTNIGGNNNNGGINPADPFHPFHSNYYPFYLDATKESIPRILAHFFVWDVLQFWQIRFEDAVNVLYFLRYKIPEYSAPNTFAFTELNILNNRLKNQSYLNLNFDLTYAKRLLNPDYENAKKIVDFVLKQRGADLVDCKVIIDILAYSTTNNYAYMKIIDLIHHNYRNRSIDVVDKATKAPPGNKADELKTLIETYIENRDKNLSCEFVDALLFSKFNEILQNYNPQAYASTLPQQLRINPINAVPPGSGGQPPVSGGQPPGIPPPDFTNGNGAQGLPPFLRQPGAHRKSSNRSTKTTKDHHHRFDDSKRYLIQFSDEQIQNMKDIVKNVFQCGMSPSTSKMIDPKFIAYEKEINPDSSQSLFIQALDTNTAYPSAILEDYYNKTHQMYGTEKSIYNQ